MSDRLARADAIEGAGIGLARRRAYRSPAGGGSPLASRPSPCGGAIAMVCEHGPDGVSAIVQGRLVGNQITEGGIMVQPKVQTAEKAEAAAA
jgi:hypothetical protein